MRRIVTERSSPARLGLAVAVGVLIGTSPFIGFHLALCLLVATLLGLNRAVTYLAAHVSVPWLLPLLVFASIQIGTRLLTGAWLPVGPDALRQLDPWQFGEAWLLGSAVLGTAMGIPAGAVVYGAARLYRKRHPLPRDPVEDAMKAAAAHFLPQGRWVWGYVRGKFRHDPAFRQLAERSPLPSPVLDVGCGRGQTLTLLGTLQPDMVGVGLDWDEAKLARARQATAGVARLRFEPADVRTAELPRARTILLIDVLHYNPLCQQDALLGRAARALLPDGVLYVREVDAAAGWRARLTMWQERIGCALGVNRGATLCFRAASDLKAALEKEGLAVSTTASHGELPLANVLLEARRATPTAGQGQPRTAQTAPLPQLRDPLISIQNPAPNPRRHAHRQRAGSALTPKG